MGRSTLFHKYVSIAHSDIEGLKWYTFIPHSLSTDHFTAPMVWLSCCLYKCQCHVMSRHVTETLCQAPVSPSQRSVTGDGARPGSIFCNYLNGMMLDPKLGFLINKSIWQILSVAKYLSFLALTFSWNKLFVPHQNIPLCRGRCRGRAQVTVASVASVIPSTPGE